MLFYSKTIPLFFILLLTSVTSFDFLYFAQEWSPGTCAHSDCRLPDAKAVSVVGLFPYFLNDTWPIYCNPSERYQAEKIHDLRDLLHEKLIGQYRQNDEVLWEDLWNMHGTCSDLSQPDYFNILLQLSLKYDLEDALETNEILPSDDRLYKASNIRKTIKKQIGASPQLDCEGKDLTKVWICLDTSFTPIRCPIPRSSTCGEKVLVRATSHTLHGMGFAELLGLEHQPQWVIYGFIPCCFLILVISNSILAYRLVKSFFKKKHLAEGEKYSKVPVTESVV